MQFAAEDLADHVCRKGDDVLVGWRRGAASRADRHGVEDSIVDGRAGALSKAAGCARERHPEEQDAQVGLRVALTLPDEVVTGLRPDVELLSVADNRSLIVVKRSAFSRLPGVDIVPLAADRAFLALPPDRGLSDLELAVLDRLEQPFLKDPERDALRSLRSQLRSWRMDRSLDFRTRAIIVVEQRRKTRPRPLGNSPTK